MLDGHSSASDASRTQGFDEYMNLVLDDAEEVHVANTKIPSKKIGRILLKGENITLMQNAGGESQ
jgi:small nuclear ribonucleoprotein E